MLLFVNCLTWAMMAPLCSWVMGRTAVAEVKNMFLKGVGTGWNYACLFFGGYIAETFFGST